MNTHSGLRIISQAALTTESIQENTAAHTGS